VQAAHPTFLDEEEVMEEAVNPSQLAVSQQYLMNFELVARAVNTGSCANSLCCPDCQSLLNLHQPDEERPSQLLGTCDGCSRWFLLVETDLEWDGTLLFELPSADAIRAMLVAPSSAR
jgi:hypothetical protein